ncbi:MAG TPA: ATP synthase F1 subunit delta [Thermoanaerobaculia bacterium]
MIRRFARPYAQALLKVAGGTEQGVAVRDQLRALRDAMEAVPGIARLAANPAVPVPEKSRILRRIGERLGLGDLAFRFVDLLLSNYRLQHLPAVLEALEAELDRRLGVATAQVTTAHPLDAEETERLRQALGGMLDRRVDLELEVDPGLIAGFRARVGSTLYDASLKGQLDRLAERLAEA